jgi:hypothetical protein
VKVLASMPNDLTSLLVALRIEASSSIMEIMGPLARRLPLGLSGEQNQQTKLYLGTVVGLASRRPLP